MATNTPSGSSTTHSTTTTRPSASDLATEVLSAKMGELRVPEGEGTVAIRVGHYMLALWNVSHIRQYAELHRLIKHKFYLTTPGTPLTDQDLAYDHVRYHIQRNQKAKRALTDTVNASNNNLRAGSHNDRPVTRGSKKRRLTLEKAAADEDDYEDDAEYNDEDDDYEDHIQPTTTQRSSRASTTTVQGSTTTSSQSSMELPFRCINKRNNTGLVLLVRRTATEHVQVDNRETSGTIRITWMPEQLQDSHFHLLSLNYDEYKDVSPFQPTVVEYTHHYKLTTQPVVPKVLLVGPHGFEDVLEPDRLEHVASCIDEAIVQGQPADTWLVYTFDRLKSSGYV